jgi:hypothetical protein
MSVPLDRPYTHHKPTCERRVRAVGRMLDSRASSPLCVPVAVIVVGGLLVALTVLNIVMVLSDLF